MRCSGICDFASNVASKLTNALTPKQGKKVGFLTDAAAGLVVAVTAAVDPFFAIQLGGTYLLGRTIHNAGVESDKNSPRVFQSVEEAAAADAQDIDPDQTTVRQKLESLHLSEQEIAAILRNS